jgi:hypothetical protein
MMMKRQPPTFLVHQVRVFQREFRRLMKEHSRRWDAIYRSGRMPKNNEAFCYDGDAVDDGFEAILNAARAFDRTQRRHSARSKK